MGRNYLSLGFPVCAFAATLLVPMEKDMPLHLRGLQDRRNTQERKRKIFQKVKERLTISSRILNTLNASFHPTPILVLAHGLIFRSIHKCHQPSMSARREFEVKMRS